MRRAGRPLGQLSSAWQRAVFSTEAKNSTEVGKLAPFWAQHQIKDLENTTVELELARRHNSSFPYYKDQLIVGQIVRVDRDHVTVSTGHRHLSAFAKKELDLSQLVKSTDSGMRTGPRDFRVGDVMHFMLDELQTPFGDMSLRINKAPESERPKLVWKEITEAFENKKVLKGRILNTIKGGFALGIAGFVGFLPGSLCSILTASKVGLLQDFMVSSIDENLKSFVAVDVAVFKAKAEQDDAFRKRAETRLQSLRKNLELGEAPLKEAAENRAKSSLDLGLSGSHMSAILDVIAIWRLEQRLKQPPAFPLQQRPAGAPDYTALDRFQRLLTSSLQSSRQAVLPTERYLPVLESIRGTAAHEAAQRVISKLAEWGIVHKSAPSNPSKVAGQISESET